METSRPSIEPSTSQTRHNLPLQATPLVGRESQAQSIRQALKHDAVPLLTLTGPGGVGKTRLALQVAREMVEDFSDGVFFLPLSTVGDTPSLIEAIVRVLDLEGEPGLEVIKAHLKSRNMLLVLDNFEQLLASAGVVAELLSSAPHLKVLVTSQAPLHILGKHEFPVPPLALPNSKVSIEELGQYEAIRLFVQRAKAVKPDFLLSEANAQAVLELCRHLDGLPLALELAAARIKLLSPEALLGRIGERLKLLTGGPRDLPLRHQTLRATLDWSFNLLSEEEKRLFCRMGIFVGGASLEALEVVCVLDGSGVFEPLSSLVEKSLIVAGEETEPRFRMLQTIREYASEKLEASGELGVLGERHARFFLKLAEASLEGLAGPEQTHWSRRLGLEQDNFRLALGWCLENHQAELGQRLAVALHTFWEVRGYFSEGRRWLEAMLAAFAGDAKLRGALFHAAANLARQQGDLEVSQQQAQQALEIRRASGDKRLMAESLQVLATLKLQHGDQPAALAALEEVLLLHRELGNPMEMARALNNLGVISQRMGALEQARQYYQEGLELADRLGNAYGRSFILCNLAMVLHRQGDLLGAHKMFEKALALDQQLSALRSMGETVLALGHLEQDHQNYQSSQAYFEQSREVFRQAGDQIGAAVALGRMGIMWVDAGRLEEAGEKLEQALSDMHSLDFKIGSAHVLAALGRLHRLRGDSPAATRIYQEALALAQEIEAHELVATSWLGLALLAQAKGDLEAALKLLREGLPKAHATYMRLVAAYLEAIAGIWADLGQNHPAAQLFGASEALRQTIHTPIPMVDRLRYDRATAKVREGLQQDAFETAWSSGRSMALEEVVSFALGEVSVSQSAKAKPQKLADLTLRELEVLQLLAQGHSTKKIASELELSFHTANAHVRNIMSKLGVSTRSAATRKALELKLV